MEDQKRSASKQDISYNDVNETYETFMPTQSINKESVEIQCDSQDLMLYDHTVRANNNTANNNTITNCDQEFTQEDFIQSSEQQELHQRHSILMCKEQELMDKE